MQITVARTAKRLAALFRREMSLLAQVDIPTAATNVDFKGNSERAPVGRRRMAYF